MGILFRKPSPKTTGVTHKKFIKDSDITKKDIRDISRKAGLIGSSARYYFRKKLSQAQRKGLSSGEVKDILQDMVGERYISRPARARTVAKTLGMSGKEMLHFESAADLRKHEDAPEQDDIGGPVAAGPTHPDSLKPSEPRALGKASGPRDRGGRLPLKPLPPLPSGPLVSSPEN